jgi:hypothetical protein
MVRRNEDLGVPPKPEQQQPQFNICDTGLAELDWRW